MQEDRISVVATGLGTGSAAEAVEVVIGQQSVPADAIQLIAPGVWQISARVPRESSNDAVPLSLRMRSADGHWLTSNTVTIAIEGPETN
jgi:uncharacterized protein (TIGR03437 family)